VMGAITLQETRKGGVSSKKMASCLQRKKISDNHALRLNVKMYWKIKNFFAIRKEAPVLRGGRLSREEKNDRISSEGRESKVRSRIKPYLEARPGGVKGTKN